VEETVAEPSVTFRYAKPSPARATFQVSVIDQSISHRLITGGDDGPIHSLATRLPWQIPGPFWAIASVWTN